MLKKIIPHLLLLLPLVFSPLIYSFEPFVNHPSNPLPFANNFPGWNEARAYQPSVIFDNGIYKMWYASYNNQNFKIAYATSWDGISWTRQNLLDVFPGFDNHDPSILKTDNGYTLFFTASTNGGSQNFKIYKINSTDGINFDSNSRQLVLQPGNSLESNAVSSPFVFFENYNYYLFYECWGNQGFRVCMATSSDGTQWQRCSNNPIITENSDGPSLLKKDNKHYLFFQSSLGIRLAESSNTLSCTMNWANFQTILPNANIGPTILDNQNSLNLYYTGSSPSGFKIHLASTADATAPTPSPILTNTPIPTPVKKKIILVPGTFASWNKEAMLHNLQVDQSEWKLLNFVKEYHGLVTSLENLQYQPNEDYFIFPYDWRKNIEDIADDLNNYVDEQNFGNNKINLVGHSLGGLVSRFYAQKYGTSDIEKIITVGSPHQGTASTYKLVAAGELDRENTAAWLLQKLYLQAHRKNFKTDKDLVSSLIPLSKDLFPIYDFLVDQENNLISIADMQIKNINLLSYAPQLSDLFPILSTISGEKGSNTLRGFTIEPRKTLDILLNRYPDGRPTGNIFDLGDNIVTKFSSAAGTDLITLNGDHGEIIYKKQSVSNILNKLGISHNQNQLEEGRETKITPSLIFALFSPATMKINFGPNEFEEEEGLVFIENAQPGDYELQVKGKFPGGKYSVLIGQISEDQDKWFEINGEINNLLPFLQTDAYTITFNPNDLSDNPVNQDDILSLFDLLIKRLTIINEEYGNKYLQNSINKTQLAKKEYLKENFRASLSLLKEVNHEIFKAENGANTVLRNNLFDSVLQLENLYEKVAESNNILPPQANLLKKLKKLKNEYLMLENRLFDQKNNNLNITDRAISLSIMSEKLQKAEVELNENNLALTEILLLSAQYLSKEIR